MRPQIMLASVSRTRAGGIGRSTDHAAYKATIMPLSRRRIRFRSSRARRLCGRRVTALARRAAATRTRQTLLSLQSHRLRTALSTFAPPSGCSARNVTARGLHRAARCKPPRAPSAAGWSLGIDDRAQHRAAPCAGVRDVAANGTITWYIVGRYGRQTASCPLCEPSVGEVRLGYNPRRTCSSAGGSPGA
ncbi:hypothetical protein GCM10020220_004890 [Nonomuraea rubra]